MGPTHNSISRRLRKPHDLCLRVKDFPFSLFLRGRGKDHEGVGLSIVRVLWFLVVANRTEGEDGLLLFVDGLKDLS